MKGFISSIYFILSALLIVFIAYTPLSFHGDFIRLINWVMIVSIVLSTLLLLIARRSISPFFWKIGLALVIVCIFCVVTGVKYYEDMDVYSWRVALTFGTKFEASKGVFEFMEIANLLSVPLIILIDIYLWFNLVRSFMKMSS